MLNSTHQAPAIAQDEGCTTSDLYPLCPGRFPSPAANYAEGPLNLNRDLIQPLPRPSASDSWTAPDNNQEEAKRLMTIVVDSLNRRYGAGNSELNRYHPDMARW